MLNKLAVGLVLVATLLEVVMIHAQSATAHTAPIKEVKTINQNNPNEYNNTTPLAPFTVRLHLIRHGETEANVANLVLGQGDSPLTPLGLEVAARAASSDLRTRKYWRRYCSDLYRAHRTARIVLGLEDVSGNSLQPSSWDGGDLVVDSRLRELAKGAREGYLKSLSYTEAMELRMRDSNGEIEIPLLESIDDAWERVRGWVDSLVLDAFGDFDSMREHEKAECEAGNAPKIYDVFALSHSALIRTLIHKMVDDQLPPDYAKTKEGSLSIPNLSCTTIDVRPYTRNESGTELVAWRPSLVRLTDTSHLNAAASSSISGPPYL